MRRQTFDIDILIILSSSNGDRKIMPPFGIKSRYAMQMSKWNESNQFR